MGGRVDGGGGGDRHSVEDLFSLGFRGRFEGRHEERDDVEEGSGRTVEES